jgi:Ca2+/Na+ antiporter
MRREMNEIEKIKGLIRTLAAQLLIVGIASIVGVIFGPWKIILYYIPAVIICFMIYLWWILREDAEEQEETETELPRIIPEKNANGQTHTIPKVAGRVTNPK